MDWTYTASILFAFVMGLTSMTQFFLVKNKFHIKLKEIFIGLLSILVFVFFLSMVAAGSAISDSSGAILIAIGVLGMYLSVIKWFNSLDTESLTIMARKPKEDKKLEEHLPTSEEREVEKHG
jgi:hypothetical protein